MNILVTGSAGFIGANLVLRLLENQEPTKIIGLDNLNHYYDPSLKEYRLGVIDEKAKAHSQHEYTFVKGSIADRDLVNQLFAENNFDIVVNLAAQAGVRYSIENPDAYIESNIVGFYNILEPVATILCSIWCMLHQAVYMVATKKCLSVLMTV